MLGLGLALNEMKVVGDQDYAAVTLVSILYFVLVKCFAACASQPSRPPAAGIIFPYTSPSPCAH